MSRLLRANGEIIFIQDDFAQVIMVSHLPSMKDQFPVHFVVETRATESQISIVEQG